MGLNIEVMLRCYRYFVKNLVSAQSFCIIVFASLKEVGLLGVFFGPDMSRSSGLFLTSLNQLKNN